MKELEDMMKGQMKSMVKTMLPFWIIGGLVSLSALGGAIWSGEKTFVELKKDRGCQAGDRLVLQEYDPEQATFLGREVHADVICCLPIVCWVPEGMVHHIPNTQGEAQPPAK